MSHTKLHKLESAARITTQKRDGSYPLPSIPSAEAISPYLETASGRGTGETDWARIGKALVTLGLSEAVGYWNKLNEQRVQRERNR